MLRTTKRQRKSPPNENGGPPLRASDGTDNRHERIAFPSFWQLSIVSLFCLLERIAFCSCGHTVIIRQSAGVAHFLCVPLCSLWLKPPTLKSPFLPESGSNQTPSGAGLSSEHHPSGQPGIVPSDHPNTTPTTHKPSRLCFLSGSACKTIGNVEPVSSARR